MSDIDPVQFGKMCGFVEATHTNVIEMDKKLDAHADRIKGLETRNETVKDGWKKAGLLATVMGGLTAVWGVFK